MAVAFSPPSSESEPAGGAFGSGMKEDSTSSPPRTWPPPEKASRRYPPADGASEPRGGPALNEDREYLTVRVKKSSEQDGEDLLGSLLQQLLYKVTSGNRPTPTSGRPVGVLNRDSAAFASCVPTLCSSVTLVFVLRGWRGWCTTSG